MQPAPPETSAPPALPPLTAQAERLVGLGVVHPDAAVTPARLRAAVAALAATVGTVGTAPATDALLVLHPRVAPPSSLAPHLRLPAPGRAGAAGEERAGFVVEDMTDVDLFGPTEGVELPAADVYAVLAPRRGDELRGWSPEEAAPALAAGGRTPLTLAEGIHWALQTPAVLERNACYMTLASRLRRPDGRYDSRTPALWVSGGTGRDGRERRGAPKVGWCWWGNRHTWLGFASAAGRVAA
ncbi:hypothetical protein DNL40_06845 [Xylanimonas oleitrophica]|uniref:Uncharacterized protein n=1 Tax=Xylanimonas oleitrophica TaxID=2607479 RepID=A0A2W5Y6P6_9MICO|nr:hypothetical protein DNL40_06845 [Xylanimonas oleitrophica]